MFVTARVTVAVGDGVNVGVDVSVGMANAVPVRPEEKVTTARVWASSILNVGVASTSLELHALTNQLNSTIHPKWEFNIFVFFNLISPILYVFQ